MRRIVCSIAAAVLLAFTLQSCSSNSAKGVADKWLTSFYHMDFDGAKKLSTDDTKKMLDMLQQIVPAAMPDSSKEQLKKTKIEVKNVVEKGDAAVATYVTSDNPKDQTLHLVKKDGKWLVQSSKEDLGDQSQQGGDQPSGPADSTSMTPPATVDTSAAPK